ncbi:MAG: pyruvate dehydrogenase (acetyl-transferring) E1 component subunit alpha [Nanoarchaeota archaeon]|nr:pyruvate dehydrogenase (acetyl-transferring) E1 component subunit alpha [Nanoarchaeota archaeon]
MIKRLKSFEIDRLEILDENGKADTKLMPKLSDKQIKDLYYWMVLTREFDLKALKLQRGGRMGTYASMLGQEASIIGSTFALRKDDWLFPSFRFNGGMMMRGVPMHQIYMYYGGDERGMNFKEDVNVFPICITVGEQPLHATGFAMGLKFQKKKSVVLTDIGDGGTSEGDFHEALNFAGVFESPVIILCQNNHYAISVPVERQTHAQSIAQKAIAYGIYGIQVDGNDVFAVYRATEEAIKRAEQGMPTLIEADTYRMSDHTTSDDAKKYRDDKEVKRWAKRDPILRLRLYMEKKKIWNKSEEKKLLEKVQQEVDTAVKKYENMKPADPQDIFKYLFAEGGK